MLYLLLKNTPRLVYSRGAKTGLSFLCGKIPAVRVLCSRRGKVSRPKGTGPYASDTPECAFLFYAGAGLLGAGPSGKEQSVTGRGSLFYFSRLHTAALRSNRQCGGSCLWVGPPRPILHPRSRCRRAASYGGQLCMHRAAPVV